MNSIATIFGMVQDGTFTKELAKEWVNGEAERIAEALKIPTEQARKTLLANIGYCTGYCSHEQADRIMDLFETEHPIFGKTHPTPEEVLRLGMEHGKQSIRRKLIEDDKG